MLKSLYLLSITTFFVSLVLTVWAWLSISQYKPILAYPIPNSSQQVLVENPSNFLVTFLGQIFPYSLSVLALSTFFLIVLFIKKR
ncbi:hypothetical protein EEL31_23940 [Brevibacillus laterosporus]|nr:hypothetical protein EEL31_23940 [Brevibacillus laterosporus]